MLKHLSTLLAVLCITGCGTSFEPADYADLAAQYDVTITRDTFGVPHIHGKTDADAAFGLAYAQAEDNWALIEESIPLYRGTNAKYTGPDGAVLDYLIGWLNIWDDIERKYTTDLRPDTRAYVEAFADGINYYAARNPQTANLDLFPLSGKDVVAGFVLRHLLFYGFDGVVRELTGSTRQHPVSTPNSVSMGGLPIGSNAFAVAPKLSEDGATRLAINSHQPTTGPVAWYEAHIQSDEGLDIMGGLFPSSPTINLGFTQQLAWGVTVNRPDLVDIYVLDIDPDNPMRYRLDGQWQDLQQRDIEIEVTLWGWLPWTASEPAYTSEHGPVMQTEHGTYAVRYAGMGEVRQVQQWLDMNKAQNFDQWRQAMQTHSFASFNFVYADVQGNIMFVHNSLTPLRKPGYNWQHYLPGDDSSLIWQAYLPFDDLPQVTNPAAGFVHSANQSPFKVTATDDNPDSTRYPTELGFPTRMTNRADRGLELFAQLAPISAEDFNAIKHDKVYAQNSRAAKYLREVINLDLPADAAEHHRQAQAILARWDRSTDKSNTGAALGVCVISAEWQNEQQGKPAPAPLEELTRCADLILAAAGRLDPPWGTINRHIRGEVNTAVAGGPDTLRAIYGRGLEDEGFLTNVAGDGLYYLVSWDPAGQLDVEGIHHFGSATLDAQSPHYADQAELFAQETLRDPWFDPMKRSAHIKSRYRPGEEKILPSSEP